MAERHIHPNGSANRKPMFFFFTLVIFLCVSSWFYILSSTGRPYFADHSVLSTSKPSIGDDNGVSFYVNGGILRTSSAYSDHNGPGEEGLSICHPDRAVLKVFMYDLPPEFHFGLLDWKPRGAGVWPDLLLKFPSYPGGLNLQHSIEYWLTLDLLSSRLPGRPGPCTAVRVNNSREADVVFVPFFSSLSYNRQSKIIPPQNVSRNKLLQSKLVKFLSAQDEWKRSGGHDHIILAHHPNSMFDARLKLSPCLFILSDFGRYPPNVANVDKDIIAPYKHVVKNFVNDSSTFHGRPILLYFQGAIHRKDGGHIRQDLYHLLKDEKDVHFSAGSVRENGTRKTTEGMQSSKFCLNIAGDTPSSNRLFDAVASHCVPVIISDDIELPFEDVLDYSEFCIFVRTSDALQKGFLIELVRSISSEEWTQMWKRIKEVQRYFEFQYPSQENDAVQMIWQAIARKAPTIRFRVNRWRRYMQHGDEDEA